MPPGLPRSESHHQPRKVIGGSKDASRLAQGEAHLIPPAASVKKDEGNNPPGHARRHSWTAGGLSRLKVKLRPGQARWHLKDWPSLPIGVAPRLSRHQDGYWIEERRRRVVQNMK